MQNQADRARMVTAAIAFLADTSLAPDCYERYLLTRFIAGELTIYQVLDALEASQAHWPDTSPPSSQTNATPCQWHS